MLVWAENAGKTGGLGLLTKVVGYLNGVGSFLRGETIPAQYDQALLEIRNKKKRSGHNLPLFFLQTYLKLKLHEMSSHLPPVRIRTQSSSPCQLSGCLACQFLQMTREPSVHSQPFSSDWSCKPMNVEVVYFPLIWLRMLGHSCLRSLLPNLKRIRL